MRTLSALILSCTIAMPAAAQETNSPPAFPELKLPEKLDEAFREMMESLKPTLDETLKFMESFEGVGDPRHYHLPEVLPNGDIILRRKEGAPPFTPEPDERPSKPGVRT